MSGNLVDQLQQPTLAFAIIVSGTDGGQQFIAPLSTVLGDGDEVATSSMVAGG